jgi:DNA adenine methylase
MGRAKEGDVVYCDPPYVPLNDTAKFTQYSAGGFSQADQERLADAARRLARKGIVTVISNHGVGRATGIYEGARIERFSVRRNISCKGLKRDMVDEVLAVFK